MDKTDIKGLAFEDLVEWLSDNGEPKYRARQIFDWLYKPNVEYPPCSFEAMTNLSKSLRNKLDDKFFIGSLKILESHISSDGTVKYILEAQDGVCFESVSIPGLESPFCHADPSFTSADSLTICISTQAGCKMGCVFCATGKQEFHRSLTTGEIYDQVRLVSQSFGKKASNVVVMGQGEPFQNFNALRSALDLLNDKNYMCIGARKITVSSCGVIIGIEKFSLIEKQFGLAISLHSCIQQTRDRLMPGVARWPLPQLRQAIVDYIAATNRRPTFEYVMIEDVNDNEEHFDALVEFCKGLLCHVNLLTYNNVEGCGLKGSSKSKIVAWVKELNNRGITTTHRISRGSDIAGACGQLINSE